MVRDPPESARQAALSRLLVLEKPEEQAYADITRMAADLCGTPMALISLINHKHRWFKERIGEQSRELPSEESFCYHALTVSQSLMIVEDTRKDERFANHPLVVGAPYIRFYAGAPLLTQEDCLLGAVCVIDNIPRSLQPNQLIDLQFMAKQVMVMLESRASPITDGK